VDAGIVMAENVLRHAEQYYEKHGEYRSRIGEITLRAATLVGRPIFFSMAIIILAFIPVFALTGMEGRLFHPLAFTKTFAMAGFHNHCRNAGAGAMHISHRRAPAPGTPQPCDESASGDLSTRARLRIEASRHHTDYCCRCIWFRGVFGLDDRIGVHASTRRRDRDVDADYGSQHLPH
jgi:hypothetical protein